MAVPSACRIEGSEHLAGLVSPRQPVRCSRVGEVGAQLRAALLPGSGPAGQ